MRLTLDLDDTTLQAAKGLSGLRSTQEVVLLALEELIRELRLRDLRARIGKGDPDLTQEDLERMRADD
jgi:hypothetical protein